jgi:hypothetical protein
MKKIFLFFSLIALVIFIIWFVGQSSFFLRSNIENDSNDAVRQEEMQPPQNNDEHVSPDDTLSDKAGSGKELERDIKVDTGTYQGQIDSNFIEIAVSGVPEEKATMAFMLSEELKDEFENIPLSTGDTIKFRYYIDEYERNVIVEIEN